MVIHHYTDRKEKLDTKFSTLNIKKNCIFWTGTLFNHIDNEYKCYRNRIEIYNKLQNIYPDIIYNPGKLKYTSFLNEMNKCKFSLDLLGIGCPNMRTFEILSTNSLRIAQYSNLTYPFEEKFSEETIFKDENDYFIKISNLINDDDLYNKCLKNQQNIVNKYFNKTWIKNYTLFNIIQYYC